MPKTAFELFKDSFEDRDYWRDGPRVDLLDQIHASERAALEHFLLDRFRSGKDIYSHIVSTLADAKVTAAVPDLLQVLKQKEHEIATFDLNAASTLPRFEQGPFHCLCLEIAETASAVWRLGQEPSAFSAITLAYERAVEAAQKLGEKPCYLMLYNLLRAFRVFSPNDVGPFLSSRILQEEFPLGMRGVLNGVAVAAYFEAHGLHFPVDDYQRRMGSSDAETKRLYQLAWQSDVRASIKSVGSGGGRITSDGLHRAAQLSGPRP